MKRFKEFREDTRKDALKRASAMHRFKQKGGKIGVFPINAENWQDIGQP